MCHLDRDKQGPLGLFINNKQLKEPAIAQFFFINNYVIHLITIWSLNKVAQCSQKFGLKVIKYEKTFKKLFKIRYILYENWPNVDLLTMLWTTEVLINKIINEQKPRVVYFASHCRGKWLLMMTTGFCSMSPSIGWVTYSDSLSDSNILHVVY